MSIKIINAGLDEGEKGEIVLRGVVSPNSLIQLKVGDYQREKLPKSMATVASLLATMKDPKARVPDIDLGMRGGNYIERDGIFYLQDDVFIIDGLQRCNAAGEALKCGVQPHIGATIHFNTNEKWERERFKILNMNRTRVSPNVLLRNLRKESPFVSMYYALCMDSAFTLHNRVCWQQRARRQEIIGAFTNLKIMALLHWRLGGIQGKNYEQLAEGMDRVMNRIQRTALRGNMMTFWRFIDICWGVKTIHYKEKAVHIRQGFLLTLARIFNNHQNFWKDSVLLVPNHLRKKITTYYLDDPEVMRLAGSSHSGREILYEMMVKFINSGKRTNRLVPFKEPELTEFDLAELADEEPDDADAGSGEELGGEAAAASA